MYVVKLKYKDSNEVMYANNSIIKERREVRSGEGCDFDWFRLSLTTARELYKQLLMRELNPPEQNHWGWVERRPLDYLSIVDLSNYEPYSEYQVLEYKEFK